MSKEDMKSKKKGKKKPIVEDKDKFAKNNLQKKDKLKNKRHGQKDRKEEKAK